MTEGDTLSIAGIALALVGLAIQVGAIARLAVLRRRFRKDPEWERKPDFSKWRVIEPLGGGVTLFSVLPFGIAQAPTPVLAVCAIVPILLFGVGTFVGGGEGEGAN